MTSPLFASLIRHPLRTLGNLAAHVGLHLDRGEFGQAASAADAMARVPDAPELALRTTPDEAGGQLRLFVKRALTGVALFDTQMRYLAVSRRFALDHAGADGLPEALVGRSHYEVVPDVPDHWRAIHRRVLAGETLSGEDDPFPRSDGHMDWVRWEMAPWLRADGTIGGAILFSVLVTDRKQTELAQEESEQRLRAMFEQAAVGMVLAGLNRVPLRVNDKLCEITGYTREEMLARSFADITHPDDLEVDRAQTNALVAGEIATFTVEKRYLRKGGKVIWVRLTVSLLRDPEGRPKCHIGVIEDITARKRIEDDLGQTTALYQSV